MSYRIAGYKKKDASQTIPSQVYIQSDRMSRCMWVSVPNVGEETEKAEKK
jgi:hypothetical protein